MDKSDYLLWPAPARRNPSVLVLGNSLGTNFKLWDPVLEALGKDYQLLLYDPHPGQRGISGASIEGRGRELIQLLERLGIGRIDFCGVSVSGLLGQWLAINSPDRVHHLVLTNTAARIGTPETWQSRIQLILEKGLPEVAESLVNRWFSPGFSTQHPEVLRAFANDLRNFSTVEYLSGCEILRDTDFRELARQITARTLVIAGTEDLAATLADAKFLHQQIRGSRLQIFPGGHLACIESGPAFVKAVTEFLAESD